MSPDLADYSHPYEQYWRDLIGPDELDEDELVAKVPNQYAGRLKHEWGDD